MKVTFRVILSLGLFKFHRSRPQEVWFPITASSLAGALRLLHCRSLTRRRSCSYAGRRGPISRQTSTSPAEVFQVTAPMGEHPSFTTVAVPWFQLLDFFILWGFSLAPSYNLAISVLSILLSLLLGEFLLCWPVPRLYA
jgi:hypothetical protein